MMWGYGFGGGGMAIWAIISSLIWLVLIGVAVWAFVRWVSSRSDTHSSSFHPVTGGTTGPSAQEILRQRYARGEIDEQTFERMQARLTTSSASETQPSETQQEAVSGGSRPR